MLNKDHFITLAGEPDHWDDDLVRRCTPDASAQGKQPEELVAVQKEQFEKGFRTAILCRSMYGWYVRSGSALDGRQILQGTRESATGSLDGSKACAIAWGTAWANEYPQNRDFYAAKLDLAE